MRDAGVRRGSCHFRHRFAGKVEKVNRLGYRSLVIRSRISSYLFVTLFTSCYSSAVKLRIPFTLNYKCFNSA